MQMTIFDCQMSSKLSIGDNYYCMQLLIQCFDNGLPANLNWYSAMFYPSFRLAVFLYLQRNRVRLEFRLSAIELSALVLGLEPLNSIHPSRNQIRHSFAQTIGEAQPNLLCFKCVCFYAHA